MASLIGAGVSALGSVFGGKGAARAALAQAQAQQQALALQKQEFQTDQANFAPYISAGTGALGGQQTLLGLNGNAAQQGAIDNLKAGPEFTSLYGTGLDAINQNAAATGGLRGGNTALAQSNFGSSLLGTVIQNQLANLGSISSLGVGAAGTAGGLSQNNVNAQTSTLGNLGNANAVSAAAPYAAFQSALSGLGSSGAITSAFGGSQASPAAAGLGSYANTYLTGGNTYNPLGSSFNPLSGAW